MIKKTSWVQSSSCGTRIVCKHIVFRTLLNGGSCNMLGSNIRHLSIHRYIMILKALVEFQSTIRVTYTNYRKLGTRLARPGTVGTSLHMYSGYPHIRLEGLQSESIFPGPKSPSGVSQVSRRCLILFGWNATTRLLSRCNILTTPKRTTLSS